MRCRVINRGLLLARSTPVHNDIPLVIALTGKTGSGKSTIAQLIQSLIPGSVIDAFANPTKEVARVVYKFDRDQVYGPSERRNVSIYMAGMPHLYWQNTDTMLHQEWLTLWCQVNGIEYKKFKEWHYWFRCQQYSKLNLDEDYWTCRQFLISFAQGMKRDFGDDVWAKALKNREQFLPLKTTMIISDMSLGFMPEYKIVNRENSLEEQKWAVWLVQGDRGVVTGLRDTRWHEGSASFEAYVTGCITNNKDTTCEDLLQQIKGLLAAQ